MMSYNHLFNTIIGITPKHTTLAALTIREISIADSEFIIDFCIPLRSHFLISYQIIINLTASDMSETGIKIPDFS